MTMKDCQLIAETIRDSCPMSGRLRLAKAFADKLAVENERFDRELFVSVATGSPRVAIGGPQR